MNISQTIRGPGLGLSSATHARPQKIVRGQIDFPIPGTREWRFKSTVTKVLKMTSPDFLRVDYSSAAPRTKRNDKEKL